MSHPLRIVSTLPTATEIVFELGLGEQLVAISHECNYPTAALTKPRVTSTNFNYSDNSSPNIDVHVKTSLHNHRSLYQLDQALLETLRPTHLITQQLCDVCAITPSDIQAVIRDLSEPPILISLNPHSLADICRDVELLGAGLGHAQAAATLAGSLRQNLTTFKQQSTHLAPKSVVCIEWLDPLFTAGHWVPEMITAAGGTESLAAPGQISHQASWDDIVRADPDIIILMPCGFPIAKTISELPLLQVLPEWPRLRAVQTGQVWITDSASYFSQSGPRVIRDGIPLLQQIIHPAIFGMPDPGKAVLLH